MWTNRTNCFGPRCVTQWCHYSLTNRRTRLSLELHLQDCVQILYKACDFTYDPLCYFTCLFQCERHVVCVYLSVSTAGSCVLAALQVLWTHKVPAVQVQNLADGLLQAAPVILWVHTGRRAAEKTCQVRREAGGTAVWVQEVGTMSAAHFSAPLDPPGSPSLAVTLSSRLEAEPEFTHTNKDTEINITSQKGKFIKMCFKKWIKRSCVCVYHIYTHTYTHYRTL